VQSVWELHVLRVEVVQVGQAVTLQEPLPPVPLGHQLPPAVWQPVVVVQFHFELVVQPLEHELLVVQKGTGLPPYPSGTHHTLLVKDLQSFSLVHTLGLADSGTKLLAF
jgi:hypothetical protein